MNDERKSLVKIIAIVACLVVAVVITVVSTHEKATGLDSIDPEDRIWVKCNNPDCYVDYEMNKREFFAYIQKFSSPGAPPPPLECKECKEYAVYRAMKCAKCSSIFFYGFCGEDFPDRCTECGYSEKEYHRKKAKTAKRGRRK